MRKDNPYSLAFGKEPSQMLSMNQEDENIIDVFESNNVSSQIFMISGIRGSGKTVLMTKIAKYFRQKKDWLVFDLSPDMPLLNSLAAELGSEREINKLLQLEKIGISITGLNIELKGSESITDTKTALTKMLEVAKRQGKRILVTVDEVINNESVRIFSSVFQILIRQEYPIFLLMTGLYENINALQNEKTLTFLFRAPKIKTKPINNWDIAQNYKTIFNIDYAMAKEMCMLTNGYPFAFQVLGYFTWEENGEYKNAIDDYKNYLYEYVYAKLWLEMSARDRELAYGIAKSSTGSISEIKSILNMSQSKLNPYRKRLLDKGIADNPERAKLKFTLPFFKEFVLEETFEEED